MGTTQTFKYKSTDVALVLIDNAIKHHVVLNQTKVQKLMFVLYTLSLITNNERLTDESPKAWPYGPVFPTVRNNLKRWEIDLETFRLDENTEKVTDKNILSDANLQEMCDSLMNSSFAKMTSSQLVTWTHTVGAPWDITTKKDGFKWGEPISDDLIRKYYAHEQD